jgi:hypothetical protein
MEANNELMSGLTAGEITQEQFDLAKEIVFNINEEDIILFVQGMSHILEDIFSVSYADIQSKYDGAYAVTMKDDCICYYGWYDADSTVTLYRIH